MGQHQLSSLQPMYQLCPMHVDDFDDIPQVSNQEVCSCCISVFSDQLLFWGLLEFNFV
jgi:hypothetical protein